MQRVPSREGTKSWRQRWTTHLPDRQETSATPVIAVQSSPMGEYVVRGNTQPPPTRGDKSMSVSTRHGDSVHAECLPLTALEIARNIDTLPRAGAATKDTAGCPSGPVLRTGAAADPALLVIARLQSGTRSRRHALAVA